MFDANEAINDIIEELEITEANKDFIGNMNKAVNTKINKIKNAGSAKIQKLKNDGYEVISGPRTTGDGYYESCVLDPEGNQIEITTD